MAIWRYKGASPEETKRKTSQFRLHQVVQHALPVGHQHRVPLALVQRFPVRLAAVCIRTALRVQHQLRVLLHQGGSPRGCAPLERHVVLDDVVDLLEVFVGGLPPEDQPHVVEQQFEDGEEEGRGEGAHQNLEEVGEDAEAVQGGTHDDGEGEGGAEGGEERDGGDEEDEVSAWGGRYR